MWFYVMQGFPFDDDDEPRVARSFVGRPRDRTFANRGGGFAETLHEPPWDEECRNKRHVPEPAAPSGLPKSPLNQHGLRNTVPFTQQPHVERPGRAMSAPPGDRPQRFTSTCEIPVMGDGVAQPPPAAQQPAPAFATPNNVRVIPIQVEGRDEPLVNSNIDTSTNFAADPPAFDARLPRDFGPFRKHSARFQQSPPHQQQYQQPPPHQQQYQQPPSKPQKQQPQQQAKQQPPQPQPAPQPQPQPNQRSADEPDRAAPPDPTALALARISEVDREVEALAQQVDAATVTSRKDKQYMYLDEMLTRQLLRLDDVDPAGQDNIRQARRNAIRAIQKCISVLESKIPGEAMEVDTVSDINIDEAKAETTEPMAVNMESQETVDSQSVPPAAESTPPVAENEKITNNDQTPSTAEPPV